MKIIGIVQARTGSSRLPGKVMFEAAGKPLILHLLERMKLCEELDELWLATSTHARDDRLVEATETAGFRVFRGSESDVLARFYHLAYARQADAVVRLTGDCPLHDPRVVDAAVCLYRENQPATVYLGNVHPRSYPDGLDVEVFGFNALATAHASCQEPEDREHVTPGILRQLSASERENLTAPADFSHLRWTLDYAEDFTLIRTIFERLYPLNPGFSWFDVLSFVTAQPDLLALPGILNRPVGGLDNLQRIHPAEGGGVYPPGGGARTCPATARQKYLDNLHQRYGRSQALLARAKQLNPLGAQTISKSFHAYPALAAPHFLERGQGAHVWDVDGHEYVDFVNGLLPVILGYGDAEVDAAVYAQLKRGVSFSLATRLEVELAEVLAELIPCAERIRFGKNGSDATSAAIRVARAYTGRDRIASCGYHGWHDWYIGSTTRFKGVPAAVRELSHTFAYNELDSLERVLASHPAEFAAVILEPMNVATPLPGFLRGVRDLAHAHGALLILDEIITGFRFHLGGAQVLFDVTPDLATFGKSMANGLPLSVVVGRADYMQEMDDIFYSGTFAGEALSLAASMATIQKMQREPVVEHLLLLGTRLVAVTRALIASHGLSHLIAIVGHPSWTILQFRDAPNATSWEIKSLYLQEVLARGILSHGSHNLSYAHTGEDLARLHAAQDEAFRIICMALDSPRFSDFLAGRPIEPVFRVR